MRGNALFVAGVATVLALVVVAYLAILGSGQETPEPQFVDDPRAAQLTKTDGAVELRVGGGEWKQAMPGQVVNPGDDLRTGEGGAAEFNYGAELSAELRSQSSIRIDRLDDEVARFVVGKGLVIVDAREIEGGGKRVLQLTAEGSDALLETRDGRVAMLTDGAGHVQAAVTRGEATLEAQGKRVILRSGEQTTVDPGRAPGAPTAIPKSLLLKVKWPTTGKTNKRKHRVTGTASPGTLVHVAGTVVVADSKGRFSAVVALREGANKLRVQAVDVIGRNKHQQSLEIRLDTRGPTQAVQTDPNMWKR